MKNSLVIFLVLGLLIGMSVASEENSDDTDSNDDGVLVKVAVGATAAAVGVPMVATAAGFGSSGIVAGTVAAGVHSFIGKVAAGSIFAGLQSLGATGAFAATGPVGIGAAMLGGAAAYFFW